MCKNAVPRTQLQYLYHFYMFLCHISYLWTACPLLFLRGTYSAESALLPRIVRGITSSPNVGVEQMDVQRPQKPERNTSQRARFPQKGSERSGGRYSMVLTMSCGTFEESGGICGSRSFCCINGSKFMDHHKSS